MKWSYFFLLGLFFFSPMTLADYTDQDLDRVLKKWREFATFQPSLEKSSDAELMLAKAFADRLVTFIGTHVELELDLAKGMPEEEVQKNWRVYDSWKNLYRLHKSMREGLEACADEECVNKRAKTQRWLFNWVERIATKPTIMEKVDKVAREVTNRVASIFGLSSSKKDVLKASLVNAIVQIASQLIDQLEMPRYANVNHLNLSNYREAHLLILGQLARSALHEQETSHLLFPENTDENKFNYPFRYSEHLWLNDIVKARLDHMSGKTNEFIIPLRREFGGYHKLSCDNPSTGNFPAISKASIIVGTELLRCTSEQGGRYSFKAATAGADVSLLMELGASIIMKSFFPGIHWFTPEGIGIGLEAGFVPGVGGTLGMAIRPDGIRVYKGSIAFGQGIDLSLGGIRLEQTNSAHDI